MDTIFMNYEIMKTSDPHSVFEIKKNLKISDKYVALSSHKLYLEKYKKVI